MAVTYEVEIEGKKISWNSDITDSPSVADVLSAVKKEFPGVPLDNLKIIGGGYDAEIIEIELEE